MSLLGKVIFVFNETKHPNIGLVAKEHDNGLIDAIVFSGGISNHCPNLLRGRDPGNFSDDLNEVYSIVGKPEIDANELFKNQEKAREAEAKAKEKEAKAKAKQEEAKQAEIDSKNNEAKEQGEIERDAVLGREGV